MQVFSLQTVFPAGGRQPFRLSPRRTPLFSSSPSRKRRRLAGNLLASLRSPTQSSTVVHSFVSALTYRRPCRTMHPPGGSNQCRDQRRWCLRQSPGCCPAGERLLFILYFVTIFYPTLSFCRHRAPCIPTDPSDLSDLSDLSDSTRQ